VLVINSVNFTPLKGLRMLFSFSNVTVQYLSQFLMQVKHLLKSAMPNFIKLNCLMHTL